MDGRKINFPFFYFYFFQCRLPSIALLIVSSDPARYRKIRTFPLDYSRVLTLLRWIKHIRLGQGDIGRRATSSARVKSYNTRTRESRCRRSAREDDEQRSVSTWLRCRSDSDRDDNVIAFLSSLAEMSVNDTMTGRMTNRCDRGFSSASRLRRMQEISKDEKFLENGARSSRFAKHSSEWFLFVRTD